MGTKTTSKYASAVAESSKITQLAEILRARWKYEIKKLPVYRRWAWLNGDEGLRAFDAKTRSSMMKQLERRMGEMASVVCTWSWNRDFAYYGMMPPELRYVADDEIIQTPTGRRFSVRLVRSRGLVRNGNSVKPEGHLPDAEPGTARFTPPDAVITEDRYDLMTFWEAAMCTDPPSVTGIMFQRIGMLRGRERKQHDPRDRVVQMTYEVVSEGQLRLRTASLDNPR